MWKQRCPTKLFANTYLHLPSCILSTALCLRTPTFAVLLAAAALLVLGRRRGWFLRSSLHKQLSTVSRHGADLSGLEEGNAKLVPGMDPGTLSLLPAEADEAQLAMLPYSYVSTMGRSGAAATERARAMPAAPVGDTTSSSPR